jgi:integrase
MPSLMLTAAAIPGLKSKDERREEVFRDIKVRGLLLEAHPNGRKTFVAWGRLRTGRAWRLKLGVWQPGVYDLADAREDARRALAQGRTEDPAAARRREKSAGTFGDLAKTFLEDAGHTLRPTTLAGWQAMLDGDHLAGLRSRRTSEITRGDLVRLFDKMREESIAAGGKGYGANRHLEVVRRVFNWAVSKDLIAATPCVGIRKPTKEKARDRSYSDVELGALVRALGDGAMSDAIRLAMYTGVRIQQALGAPWAEFDLKAKEWRIGAARTGNKSGVAWLVPLVPAAVKVLKRWRGDAAFVFATTPRKKGGKGHAWHSENVLIAIRKRSGVVDFRPHDLRRTLSSWLASRAGGAEPQAVRDAILGHRPAGLEGVYNVHAYGDEKRVALLRWSEHVARVAAKKPAKVVQMLAAKPRERQA